MTKLLRAGFARLKKDRIFWVGMILMFAVGILFPVNNFFTQLQTGMKVVLEDIFFDFALFTGFVSAAFCSLFIGTEYSDGTIRNKLVVGHNRNAIYLSNLIVCAAAGLLMNLAYIVAASAVGIPLFGLPEIGAAGMALLLLCSLFMTLGFIAIFTLIGMLIQNKALVATLSIIGALVILVFSSYVGSRLDAPEFYEGYTITGTADGIVTSYGEEGQSTEKIPNPMYLEGTEREIFQFIYEFLPGGQAIQVFLVGVAHPWRLMLYALLVMALTTGCGLWFFRKKDIQ